MKATHLKLGLATLCLAAGAAYWYYSPLIALHQMRAAARENNAESFNERVDYPRLRESVKLQLSAVMNEEVGRRDTSAFGEAGTAIGKMLGMALADKMVDAMVRPEFVMRAMEQGTLHPRPHGAREDAPKKPDRKYTSERVGLGQFIMHLEPDNPGDRRMSLVMERHGLASWKLAEVRMGAPTAR
ncbi:DUF2939 domain-containing protein [Massilia antarctica]|uniref:DUF2939 domain-containing protein n=1 Tax=Massilia antarctica TaxID=2765360 RepID=UPI0006BB7FCC|nr:DUF2939 domain-containing protein [Massilia sp. H27-R4]CUI06279.1 hypothetical protein BN2497_7335 [Janthinobacterium sp. CG23_2]CUU30065.1 hypothetical protein BN3177_7335 [Janthinobacterium sp. CG23_2]